MPRLGPGHGRGASPTPIGSPRSAGTRSRFTRAHPVDRRAARAAPYCYFVNSYYAVPDRARRRARRHRVRRRVLLDGRATATSSPPSSTPRRAASSGSRSSRNFAGWDGADADQAPHRLLRRRRRTGHEGPAVPGQHRRRARGRARPALYDDQIDEIVFYDITASAEKRTIDLDTVRARRRPRLRARSPSAAASAPSTTCSRCSRPAPRRSASTRWRCATPRSSATAPRRSARQCIVSQHAGEARRHPAPGIPSGYEVFIDGARLATGLDAIDWVRRGEDLGAGEIVVNSIDRDGTASGYDLDDHPCGRRRGERAGHRVGRRGQRRPHRRRPHRRRRVSAAIISSILYSPRLDRNVGVRELKDGLARARRADAPVGRVPPRELEPPPGAAGRARASQSMRGASDHRRSRS